MSLVSLSTSDSTPYILLQPGSFPPRHEPYIGSYLDLNWLFPALTESEYVAVDFETRGADNTHPDFCIAGIGLAWDTGNIYFHWEDLYSESRKRLIDCLLNHKGLIAHNVYFDGGVVLSQWNKQLQWYCCTYALFAMLANEGYEGQHWSLKGAQTSLLGWEETNEGDLDMWLITNGYYRGIRYKDESPDLLLSRYQAGVAKPDKAEMWRAPKEILGKYCCLDAESTYLLFTNVLLPAVSQFPELLDFHTTKFMPLILTLIEQRILGITVDTTALNQRREIVLQEIENYKQQFLLHSETSKHISDIEQQTIDEDIVPKRPEQFKKDGTISKNFTNWEKRLADARAGLNPDYKFNIGSGPQMRELLYNRLGFEPRLLTETGLPSVGTRAYKHMGKIGKILEQHAWFQKELTFLDKYIEMTDTRPTLHPSFRTPGTTSGRLSGKEPNFQQIPKTKAIMSLFVSRPGRIWVDLDFAALESVVAAEFSQDENLLALYGNNAPENDIHLFVASHVPGDMGSRILATGYTPINPPAGTVSRAKKEAKAERSIAKTVVYACQYGAGVKKVMQTLEADDVYLPWDQVESIHSTYWNTFAQLKDFSRSLLFEWKRNKGYILNGIGRPMAVPEMMSKDLLSRFIQSTGHDILVLYVNILMDLLNEAQIDWSPVILDLHDATTVEVPEHQSDETVQLFSRAMDLLNDRLQGTIQLRGKPTVGKTLADVKEVEE